MKDKHFFALLLLIVALLELLAFLRGVLPIKAMIISVVFMFPAYHIISFLDDFTLRKGVDFNG